MRSSLALLASLELASAGVTRLDKRDPPTEIAGGWEYQGCYVDVPGRTLRGAALADPEMTNEMCTTFCASRGFSYAGTEWFQECYCGNALFTGGVIANELDCNTPCAGNGTQPCGGGSRLTLYLTTEVTGPGVNPGVDGWESMGCYSEGTTGRALTYPAGLVASTMTVARCLTACRAANFILAGIEYASECYCGNTISNGGAPAVDGCNMLCNGNSTEYCGGPDRLNVYNFEGQFEPPSTTSTVPEPTDPDASASGTAPATPTPTGPSQPDTVGPYTWYGCRTEGTGIRALNGRTTAADTMTLETCQTFCAGFTYFGTEYGRECYCGNSFGTGSTSAPASDCNMRCAGNAGQYCGAGNRLSVYSLDGAAPSGSDTPPASSAATSPPVSTTAGPAPSGYPEGWTNQGCWIDGRAGRILSTQLPDDPALTLEKCATACFNRGFTIAGAEYSTQCFCGNAIINDGALATSASQCSTTCPGNTAQMCGGPDRMSIISNGVPPVQGPPAPQTGGLKGNWVYKGCVTGTVGAGDDLRRTFVWQVLFPNMMTPSMCLDRCAQFGYAAAGLEYGEECYCGDPANIGTVGATFRPETECNILCPGNSSSICGGGSRMTTYFWEGGEPLYTWDFPQSPAEAGSYELLIGGVCIPLMTMQSITGKVTFLEKWGTGPENSTGAYELDLSLVPNIGTAWREMHVKTDIFCSSGVILPDKAGRQLTVGGWSGASTYGVRLYEPDGTTGVNGTNDWQEDVNVLSLQDGRWYPTSIMLANGSIFVIGGQIGANDAAVPTIEILPYTGSPPLFMDWLERTDPNNLYPFCAVLPSENIFVAYWNEARILDKTTFDTIAVLPNIPGAVNNPLAGRTYPLEGTGVLLPQHYPYDEPLGILICGGSTEGAATALDNCVTIYPESDDPDWVLERMPSKRVISCMAPLPDGTYLINNGAHAGVAGFGLATGPNLNALLYDPKKPVGGRISVMANTTIARMYHSESITLLDGRVMVSGSDPDDSVNPQEYRVEVFSPPYLLNGKPRPTFTLTDRDWAYNDVISFTLGGAPVNGAIQVSLLGAVSSTHSNSMGARTIFPEVSCTGTSCTVTAPPDAGICPPGWFQFFVLDGGIPAVGVYVRIGGDPAELGNWPNAPGFTTPGLGPIGS
ncbi:WSC domain-containing protein [Plectosphaerella cucumerina]|uniref:WSC domain-containing protein n=1 Tax=Plectosphaerella cucumerina TaxID=40658 RepID=A0A8K0TQ74_9PEZI|nr:WSC domain-containing protein [Plectosphaerella cucumerina]